MSSIIGLHIPTRFLLSIQERGLYGTFRTVFLYLIDCWFDFKYRVNTVSKLGLDQSGIDQNQKKHAVMYSPTHVLPLRKALSSLELRPRDVLVDFGCGKGRVLLIASQLGIKVARGVELSPVLCEIATKNCFAYSASSQTNTKFTIFMIDASQYPIREDETVFYFYNPFDESVMAKVLANISESIKRKSRKCYIVYCHPLYRNLIDTILTPKKSYEIKSPVWKAAFLVSEIE